MIKSPVVIFLIGLASGTGFFYFFFVVTPTAVSRNGLLTGQKYIENLAFQGVDLKRVEAVFDFVFSQLPERAMVYPTENYYYYSFYSQGQEIRGNLRFDVEDRDKGLLNFAYFGAVDRPENPDDLDLVQGYKKLGKEDGVVLKKESELHYSITYKEKQVDFYLNNLAQGKPARLKMMAGEQLVMRTFDESGFQFFVVFNERKPGFYFVLDETVALPDVLQRRDEDSLLLVGRRTGFAFYDDQKNNRKILFGVDADNIRQNGYFDGPFDQLADNFIQGEDFKKQLESAYPYVKGRINQRGVFLTNDGEDSGSRVALTPYLSYSSLDELKQFFSSCLQEKNALFCLTYDYKQDVPAS